MLRGRGCPASGMLARIQSDELAARSRAGTSRTARPAAARSGRTSIEKPVQNISGSSASRAPCVPRRLEQAPRAPVVLGHVLPGQVHLDEAIFTSRPPRRSLRESADSAPPPPRASRASCRRQSARRTVRPRRVVEDARRDRGDADLLDQVPDEPLIVVEPEGPEARADEVRALRARRPRTRCARAPAPGSPACRGSRPSAPRSSPRPTPPAPRPRRAAAASPWRR